MEFSAGTKKQTICPPANAEDNGRGIPAGRTAVLEHNENTIGEQTILRVESLLELSFQFGDRVRDTAELSASI